MNLFKYKDKAFAYLFKNRPRKMPISENSPIDRENRGAYLCPCAMKRECGPLAQLGERLHGMEEVVGSIPIRSTNRILSQAKLLGFFHAYGFGLGSGRALTKMHRLAMSFATSEIRGNQNPR